MAARTAATTTNGRGSRMGRGQAGRSFRRRMAGQGEEVAQHVPQVADGQDPQDAPHQQDQREVHDGVYQDDER